MPQNNVFDVCRFPWVRSCRWISRAEVYMELCIFIFIFFCLFVCFWSFVFLHQIFKNPLSLFISFHSINPTRKLFKLTNHLPKPEQCVSKCKNFLSTKELRVAPSNPCCFHWDMYKGVQIRY